MAEPSGKQPAWYSQTACDVAQALNVDPARGLSTDEAQSRLREYGPNHLAAKRKESGQEAFLRQYRDFMQILLLAVAAISLLFTGKLGTSLVLVALTVLNAMLGMHQESKAEASLSALEKMLKKVARVRRDGQAVEIDAEGVVPGDVVLIEAGIRVRMITGDHAVTAAAIGHELGIEGEALTGAQFAAIGDDDLRRGLPDLGVVARVAPEDKIRLVRLLQEQGNIVAMTDDGVNDAPALKKADIGVAMGITGTEVSKEAAVMILADDNFATIVDAVEYGRALYGNLLKYLRFQMTGLVAFIASFLGAALFAIAGGIPFAPLVILWINFLVQVPIAIALGSDRPSLGLMERRPRPPSQPVLARLQWARIVFMGLLMAAGALILKASYEPTGRGLAATMAFVVFSLFSIAIGLGCRSETETAFDRDTLGDRRQLGLYGLSFLSILVPTVMGVLQRGLGLDALTLEQWLLCTGSAVALLLVDEVIKLLLRRNQGQTNR